MAYRVSGNTYQAKELLRKAGFVWDATTKTWFGDAAAKDELEHIRMGSGHNMGLFRGVEIKEEA